ncbi:hypothetical protein CFI10_15835 [Marinobacterium iners]|uniref:hypothetical protein n=1 Tax=Marinobacterium iners TaxID=48076 RepID=UPI001A8E8E81|nr:hypothetical protein [Marinobacterium iners]QSR36424.1 hypothetical protein CFI10_15835 [Marinobacterium iners]
MPVSIAESGVTFGPYNEDDLFHIERWVKHSKLDEKGISSVEFILHRHGKTPKVLLVEAKSTVPREHKKFYAEIEKKFVDSLTLWVSLIHNRLESDGELLGSNLSQQSAFALPLSLLLVIPELPDEFLQQANDAFRKKMTHARHLWGLEYNSIFVLNKRLARQQGLI